MRKLLIVAALAVSAFANEIQVFTSNTMHIKLDSNSQIEKLYFGKSEDFYKNQAEIVKDIQHNTKSALFQGTTTALYASSGEIAKNIAAGGSGSFDSNAGLIGIGAMVAIAGGKAIYDLARQDNEYIMLSRAVNSAGEETLLYTMIVANNAVSDEEGVEIGMNNIKSKFAKGL